MSRKTLAILILLVVAVAIAASSVSASGAAPMFYSCNNGAVAYISGSGTIRVTFTYRDGLGWHSEAYQYVNFGRGMSIPVYSRTRSAYFGGVEATGSTFSVSARCR